MDTLERFTMKYQISENGCWVWQASKSKAGYGFFHDKKLMGAHRWAYSHFVGEIPSGLVIDHLCKNTSCVNPVHLEAVTQQVNFLRGTAVSKALAHTHCKQGHEYTIANTLLTATTRGRICRTCKAVNDKKYKLRSRSKV